MNESEHRQFFTTKRGIAINLTERVIKGRKPRKAVKKSLILPLG
jgi:hypothetical protein